MGDPEVKNQAAASLVGSGAVLEAFVVVGALSVVIATIVVCCHLYRTFWPRDSGPVFVTDDKLLLVYFYAVIVAFLGLALS